MSLTCDRTGCSLIKLANLVNLGQPHKGYLTVGTQHFSHAESFHFIILPPNQQAMWAVHQRIAIPPIKAAFPIQFFNVWNSTIALHPKYSSNVLKQLLAFDVPQVWDGWTHSFYASSTVCVCLFLASVWQVA